MENMSLKVFFESNGFETVDMRAKGGCLWIIGEKPVLTPFIEEAITVFEVEGRFAQGKATKYKTGWFTKSGK